MDNLRGREAQLEAFLLGGLPPEQREQLEEQAFTVDAVHEELEAAADELIHAYLAGRLSAADRRRFEGYFLASPRRRERLEFVRQLITAIDHVAPLRPAHAHRAWQLAAAALVAVGVLFLVLSRRSAPGPASEQAAAPTEAPPPSVTPEAPASPPDTAEDRRPSTQDVQVVRLARGAPAPADVDLRGKPGSVRLEVAVDEGPPSFEAILRGSDGSEVWRADELPPPNWGKPLVVSVPASAFSAAGERYALQIQPEALRDAGPSPPSAEYELRARR